VDGGRNRVVAALPHVDLVVGVHGALEVRARQRGDHLVGVHVRAGAGAGLEHVYRELCVVRPGDDLGGRGFDRRGDSRIEEPQAPVGARRRLFHQRERGDEAAWHGQAADGKVLHSALGLRAP
jgi:hypothetical protein